MLAADVIFRTLVLDPDRAPSGPLHKSSPSFETYQRSLSRSSIACGLLSRCRAGCRGLFQPRDTRNKRRALSAA